MVTDDVFLAGVILAYVLGATSHYVAARLREALVIASLRHVPSAEHAARRPHELSSLHVTWAIGTAEKKNTEKRPS